MRWSLILSRTGSMSSWVRFFDPTRPFSIPNIPPKPPFLALQRKKTENVASPYLRIQTKTQSAAASSHEEIQCCEAVLKGQNNRDFKMLPFLVSLRHHNSLLFLHFFILVVWRLIIHTSQVTFHWIHLDQLRGTQTISSAINSSIKQPCKLNFWQPMTLHAMADLLLFFFYPSERMSCQWHDSVLVEDRSGRV